MVVLDVFIGLVFVYFLYSLFVSILAELFSTWIGMRARILRQGIDNFLNDRHPEKESIRKGFFAWMHDIFLVEHASFRYTNAGKFYKEPTIKYLAKIGENKRYSLRNTKPAYIEKNHFVTAIVNMLLQRSIGVNEWDKVKFSIETNSLNLEKETLQMFKDWMVQSNDDYEKFKAYIGNSFEEVNDRLVGWYKRKIGMFLFTIGLVLAFIMNVDTFEIVKTLFNNPEKRIQLVEKATARINAGQIASTDPITTNAYNQAKSSIDSVSHILGSGWQHGFENKNFFQKAKYIWKESNPTKQKFWGFIITAFALSMGSKFWFDLLKRLVSIRGSGDKPDEHKINKTNTLEEAVIADKGLTMNTSDPALIALSENRRKWEAQPGFIAANVQYEKNNVGYIELVFEAGRDFENMPDEIPDPLNTNSPAIALKYAVGTKGSFDDDNAAASLDGSIVQDTTRSKGTPTGVAYDPRTDRNVILTSAHVVRNDKTSIIDLNKAKISINLANKTESIALGETKNLVLSSFCDAGIIKVRDDFPEKLEGLQKLNKIREVTVTDQRRRTKVKIHTLREDPNRVGKRHLVEGNIIFTKRTHTFGDSPSSDIRFYDLFVIADRNNDFTKPLTFAGDSGALITDEDDNQIGILAGAAVIGTQNVSFGIKLKDIFEILQLEPAKNEKKYNFYLKSDDSGNSIA